MTRSGIVGPDGQSAITAGLYDMAELGDAIHDPEIEERVAALLKADDPNDVQARYQLAVAFTEKRSVHEAFAGFVSAWSNGGFLHGGGDEAIYFCPARIEKDGFTKTCGAPITLKFVAKRVAVCEKCKTAHNPQDLNGQFFARLSLQHWATLLTTMFQTLGCSADIRIGYMRGDLRRATADEAVKELRGDKLGAVRTNREWAVYSLRNIVKDTSAGADLYNRIRAFLAA